MPTDTTTPEEQLAKPLSKAAQKREDAFKERLSLLHAQSKALGKKYDCAPITLAKGGYVNGAVSFGSVATDLITGGGLPPARMTTGAGPSMSGKSTLGYQLSSNATRNRIPVIYLDHEASADAKYLTALGLNLEEASGEGLFLYSQPVTGEDSYRYMHQIMDVFPDKNTSEFAPPQAIIIVDSFAGMIPEAQDEDPSKKMQMAAIAKIHAWGLPLIKAKLSKKNIALFGTNQLRKTPGVVYGNPEYEPGGEALTFYADLKLRVRGKGKATQERGRSMRHTNIEVSKNKQFPPWLKIEDQLQIAFGYGFDRFYDGLAFLKQTGQISLKKESKKTPLWVVNGFDHYKPLGNKSLPVEDLLVELFKTAFRDACTQQMASGEAFDRMFAHLNWQKMYVYDPENSGVGEEGVEPEETGEDEAMQAMQDYRSKLDADGVDLVAALSGD